MLGIVFDPQEKQDILFPLYNVKCIHLMAQLYTSDDW